MATVIRPELNKNKYKIPKHRYYELLHFCRQYNDYISEKNRIYDTYVRPVVNDSNNKIVPSVQKTENFAIKLANIDDKIRIIDGCAAKSGEDLSGFILLAVTSGITYETLKTRYNIPCSKNVFYDRYRYFFWLLNEARG